MPIDENFAEASKKLADATKNLRYLYSLSPQFWDTIVALLQAGAENVGGGDDSGDETDTTYKMYVTTGDNDNNYPDATLQQMLVDRPNDVRVFGLGASEDYDVDDFCIGVLRLSSYSETKDGSEKGISYTVPVYGVVATYAYSVHGDEKSFIRFTDLNTPPVQFVLDEEGYWTANDTGGGDDEDEPGDIG